MTRSSLKNVMKLIDSAKQELPVEQSFLNDLKRSIEFDSAKTSHIPSKTYKPSSMNCIRSMYYQITGAEPDESRPSYNFVNICNSGTDTHERIQKYVANMINNNIDCVYVDVAQFVKDRGLDYLDVVSKNGMETKLYHKTLNMSFLCDGIIKYKNHYYILEIKTETINKWYMREYVDNSHYNQGIAYSIAFGIPDVIFVYINRDMLDMKAYMFTPTDEMKEEWLSRISECDNYVNSLKVPDKPDNILKKTCNYCIYASRCREDG